MVEGIVEKEAKRYMARRIAKIVAMVVIVAPLALLVMGGAVYLLWNWLMPSLFHLPTITFWQAWGLLALSWLFFGGLRGSGPRSGYRRGWQRRMRERWEQMTPEEQEKCREWMQSPCGGMGVHAEPKSS